MIPLIDAHCHLTEGALRSAMNAGVTGLIQGGIKPEDWEHQLSLAEKHPGTVHCTLGIHPWQTAALSDKPLELQEHWKTLEKQLSLNAPRVVGIGETGLDHLPRWPRSSHVVQEEWFRRHLELSRTHHLPVVLHIVRAHAPAAKLLKAFAGTSELRGMVHAFHSEWTVAKKYLDLGLHLSIGPSLLSPRAHRLEETLRKAPLEQLLVETDETEHSPPEALMLIARRISEIKNIDFLQACNSLISRTKSLFQI